MRRQGALGNVGLSWPSVPPEVSTAAVGGAIRSPRLTGEKLTTGMQDVRATTYNLHRTGHTFIINHLLLGVGPELSRALEADRHGSMPRAARRDSLLASRPSNGWRAIGAVAVQGGMPGEEVCADHQQVSEDSIGCVRPTWERIGTTGDRAASLQPGPPVGGHLVGAAIVGLRPLVDRQPSYLRLAEGGQHNFLGWDRRSASAGYW